MPCIMSTLLQELDAFVLETGLSEHRVGIILAKNGRLIPRLREGGRIWPDTEQQVREALAKERADRAASTAPSETGNVTSEDAA